MFKLHRKDLIYLPLGIVLLIQLLDKNDSLVIVQYVFSRCFDNCINSEVC